MLNDDELTRQATFAAVALIREAIQHSEEAGGSVMETLTPLFHSLWEASGSPEGGINVTDAIVKVLACLSQVAGVMFKNTVATETGREPAMAELLVRLDRFEQALLGVQGLWAGTWNPP